MSSRVSPIRRLIIDRPTSEDASTPAVRARLSAAESQAAFRALLDAFSRPGEIFELPAAVVQRVPPALIPILALADVETSVAICGFGDGGPGSSAEWADAVLTSTGAIAAKSISDAGWVASLSAPDPALIASLRRGDPLAPEDGARLSIRVEGFERAGTEAGARRLERVTLSGPGIPSCVDIGIRGVDRRVINAIRAANLGYPAGIDVWFVADNGTVLGLPRSVHIVPVAVAAMPGLNGAN